MTDPALSCPHCASALAPERFGVKVGWTCATCSGVSFNLAVLRDEIDAAVVAQFWRMAQAARPAAVRCPSCRRAMRVVEHRTVRATLDADICVPCQIVWLDGGELDLIRSGAPRRQPARVTRPSRVTAAVDGAGELPRASQPASSVLDIIIGIIFTSFT